MVGLQRDHAHPGGGQSATTGVSDPAGRLEQEAGGLGEAFARGEQCSDGVKGAAPGSMILRDEAENAEADPGRIQDVLDIGEASGVLTLTDAELQGSTPQQRAGLIRLLVGQTWVDSAAEHAIVYLVQFGGSPHAVLAQLSAMGLRETVLVSVDDEELNAALVAWWGAHQVAGSDLDRAIAEGDVDAIMAVEEPGNLSAGQQLGMLRVLLETALSFDEREAQIIHILASGDLRSLMDGIISAGLKQALFDHIDDPVHLSLIHI